MKLIECEQNSPEWIAARLGIVTASNMHKIITPKGDASEQADAYMNQLIAEMLTGESGETWDGNRHAERGKELEEEAATWYAMTHRHKIKRVGFCTTDDGLIGCSPDYLVDDDGLLEVKTGLPHLLIAAAVGGDEFEQKHRPQTQTGLLVTEREWVDTMLYHPLMQPLIFRRIRKKLYIQRIGEFTVKFHERRAAQLKRLKLVGYMQ